jgi:hypothetical protein
VRRVFILRFLFVFVALFLIGWLFHGYLDGKPVSCVAPGGLACIFVAYPALPRWATTVSRLRRWPVQVRDFQCRIMELVKLDPIWRI